jgi:hypothetical protein
VVRQHVFVVTHSVEMATARAEEQTLRTSSSAVGAEYQYVWFDLLCTFIRAVVALSSELPLGGGSGGVGGIGIGTHYAPKLGWQLRVISKHVGVVL